MDKKVIEKLIEEAKEIAERNFCCNHAPYTVGAALLTKDGKVYKGFNVQNDGILSICAERVAFVKALSENNKEFSCIVVMGKPVGTEKSIKTIPCGYCRQFMNEYTSRDFVIYTYDEVDDKLYRYTLEELLPESFSL